MNSDFKQKEIAYHEAGHSLMIYIICGNLKVVNFVEIDKVTEGEAGKFGGATHRNGELIIKESLFKEPSFSKYREDFASVCHYYAGGIAARIMLKTKELNIESMEDDLSNIDNILSKYPLNEDIKKLAIRFCEQEFNKSENQVYLKAISEKLIERAGETFGVDGMEIETIISKLENDLHGN